MAPSFELACADPSLQIYARRKDLLFTCERKLLVEHQPGRVSELEALLRPKSAFNIIESTFDICMLLLISFNSIITIHLTI